MNVTLRAILRAALVGVGQIMLQPNWRTGAMFLLGIAIHSPLLAVATLLGSLSASIAAPRFGGAQDQWDQGIYGYNGALVVLMTFVFYAPSATAFALGLGGALATLPVLQWMRGFPVPAFTAPFVICGWAVLALGQLAGLDPASQVDLFPMNVAHGGVLDGVGQVMFQQGPMSGALFLFGLSFCSRRAALYSLGGSAGGAAVAFLLAQSHELINAGIFGYNAALVAIALGGRRISQLAIGIALSVVLLVAFRMAAIPALTGPFVLASWALLLWNRRA